MYMVSRATPNCCLRPEWTRRRQRWCGLQAICWRRGRTTAVRLWLSASARTARAMRVNYLNGELQGRSSDNACTDRSVPGQVFTCASGSSQHQGKLLPEPTALGGQPSEAEAHGSSSGPAVNAIATSPREPKETHMHRPPTGWWAVVPRVQLNAAFIIAEESACVHAPRLRACVCAHMYACACACVNACRVCGGRTC